LLSGSGHDGSVARGTSVSEEQARPNTCRHQKVGRNAVVPRDHRGAQQAERLGRFPAQTAQLGAHRQRVTDDKVAGDLQAGDVLGLFGRALRGDEIVVSQSGRKCVQSLSQPVRQFRGAGLPHCLLGVKSGLRVFAASALDVREQNLEEGLEMRNVPLPRAMCRGAFFENVAGAIEVPLRCSTTAEDCVRRSHAGSSALCVGDGSGRVLRRSVDVTADPVGIVCQTTENTCSEFGGCRLGVLEQSIFARDQSCGPPSTGVRTGE
jgi:hypothetical protein